MDYDDLKGELQSRRGVHIEDILRAMLERMDWLEDELEEAHGKISILAGVVKELNEQLKLTGKE